MRTLYIFHAFLDGRAQFTHPYALTGVECEKPIDQVSQLVIVSGAHTDVGLNT